MPRPEDLLTFIVEYGEESAFLILLITLEIMLTMAVSVSSASCKRFYSKVKLVVSYPRALAGCVICCSFHMYRKSEIREN